MEKNFKIAICTMIIILLSIIAFIGVYAKKGEFYESVLPDYKLASDFAGKRISSFNVSEETQEKIYDKDGNEVQEVPEDANEDDYTKESIKINENLTKENYEKVEKIFNGRLKEIGVGDYTVRMNKQTGEATVELADEITTDNILQYLLLKGDFAIKDADNGTVLMDRSYLKKASVVYGNNETGKVTVYLKIEFNHEGKKKLEEISKEYLKVETNNEENKDEENKNEENTVNQKKISMVLEGTEFLKTYFSEPMTEGELTIGMGSGQTIEEVYQYGTQARVYAMLLNNEEMPITYTVSTSQHIENLENKNLANLFIKVLIAIVLIVIIYTIFKYKGDGIIGGLSFIVCIALFLLLIRYTGTTISLNSFAGMGILTFIESYFIISVLNNVKNNKMMKLFLNKLDIVITILIIAIVFTFMNEVKAFSIGMTLFYGAVSITISNLVFMKYMLVTKNK